MPLYDYHCSDCGDFRSWRPMSESNDDVPCPGCDQPGLRTVSAPSLALMASNTRIAHGRNEKSADQPEVVTKATEDRTGGGHHPHSHGHHHHGHSHARGRPWMIGH
ncbi:MAG: hypothetical protein OEU92_18825 [Alphaproteobacteria bacterium]|nr:hypothetical protein [Alphaproteobacteria bacterium]